jgi:hypothetical protein
MPDQKPSRSAHQYGINEPLGRPDQSVDSSKSKSLFSLERFNETKISHAVSGS